MMTSLREEQILSNERIKQYLYEMRTTIGNEAITMSYENFWNNKAILSYEERGYKEYWSLQAMKITEIIKQFLSYEERGHKEYWDLVIDIYEILT